MYCMNNDGGWKKEGDDFVNDPSEKRSKTVIRRGKRTNISTDFEKQTIHFFEQIPIFSYISKMITNSDDSFVRVFKDGRFIYKNSKTLTSVSDLDQIMYNKQLLEIEIDWSRDKENSDIPLNTMQHIINKFFMSCDPNKILKYMVDRGDPRISKRIENVCHIVHKWDGGSFMCKNDIPLKFIAEKKYYPHVLYAFDSIGLSMDKDKLSVLFDSYDWEKSSQVIVNDNTNFQGKVTAISKNSLTKSIVEHNFETFPYPSEITMPKLPDYNYAFDVKRSGDAFQVHATAQLNNADPCNKFIFFTGDQLAFLLARLMKVPSIYANNDILWLYENKGLQGGTEEIQNTQSIDQYIHISVQLIKNDNTYTCDDYLNCFEMFLRNLSIHNKERFSGIESLVSNLYDDFKERKLAFVSDKNYKCKMCANFRRRLICNLLQKKVTELLKHGNGVAFTTYDYNIDSVERRDDSSVIPTDFFKQPSKYTRNAKYNPMYIKQYVDNVVNKFSMTKEDFIEYCLIYDPSVYTVKYDVSIKNWREENISNSNSESNAGSLSRQDSLASDRSSQPPSPIISALPSLNPFKSGGCMSLKAYHKRYYEKYYNLYYS